MYVEGVAGLIALYYINETEANWCRPLAGSYWIVNQILAKGLHNSDDESLKYTTDLMDKLEKVRLAG